MIQTRAEPPQLAWALDQAQLQLSFVASPTITRTFSFSCGFTCGFLGKFRRKHISYRFCQGFRFLDEIILGFYDPQERYIHRKYETIRKKCEIICRKCEIIHRKEVTFCDNFFAQTL